jgi:DNA-binding MarR family transcriptional regulator
MISHPKARLGLTPPQRGLKEAVCIFTAGMGTPPTYAQIALMLDCSKTNVSQLVRSLVARGHAVSSPKRRQSIALVEGAS